ncbi:DUF4179 domain-containing protein [Brevibacillus sp. 179-C9.3 HS]|uniref:DUF4179 domain-containing protein n=1 Tax=unclassified Brevibacillus TaxID=2684853 RepID=UPI0039A17F65
MTHPYKEWINIDVDQIKPLEVTDLEKARMKQRILGTKKQKATLPFLRNAAAAVIITGASLAAVSFAVPSLASQIPFMQGILSYFDKEQDHFYGQYEKYASVIKQTQSSNGITMMIENAVYDGTSITIAYALETDKNVGEHPRFDQYMDIPSASGLTGSTDIKKISDTKYAGLVRVSPTLQKDMDNIQVAWSPGSFTNDKTGEVFAGDWHFTFALPKMNSDIQLVNQSVSAKGVTLVINEIRTTDVSTIIHYKQIVDPSILEKWNSITPTLKVKDDLGNEYHVEGNGGVSDHSENYQWSATIRKVDEKATKLYIQPTIIFSLGEGKGHEEHKLESIEIPL